MELKRFFFFVMLGLFFFVMFGLFFFVIFGLDPNISFTVSSVKYFLCHVRP